MNPYTGETTPIHPELLDRLAQMDHDPALWQQERERAAAEVGLDDPADLVIIEGPEDQVQRVSRAVANARSQERRRARRKQQRASRKRNR